MSIKRVLTLTVCLGFPALWLTGCAGKVSGRFDMQQKFRTGVVIKEIRPE